jgi:hypothetical protein
MEIGKKPRTIFPTIKERENFLGGPQPFMIIVP